MRTKEDYTDIGKIHWKAALDKSYITKYQLFSKTPKGFIYGETQGSFKFTSSSHKKKMEIIIDDEWMVRKLKNEIYPYFENKDSLIDTIDKIWSDTRKQEMIDLVEGLKKLARGSNIPLAELINDLKNSL